MNKSVFSRRVFLKGSAVAVTALTLSACGGGEEHHLTTPYGYQVITNGSLTMELGSLASYAPIGFGPGYIVEARFLITNNGENPITLTPNNFTAQFNKKDAPVQNPDSISTKVDFPYLFNQMPIPSGENRKGYVLFHASGDAASHDYKITITCPEATATFAPEEKDKEWYE